MQNFIKAIADEFPTATLPNGLNATVNLHNDNFLKLGARIEHAYECIRIDAYLAKKFPFLSRVQWQKRIENFEIRVIHVHSQTFKNVKVTYHLKKYDQIFYYQAPKTEKMNHLPIDVIYDDGDICIFSKPPHMVVHPVGIYGKDNFITHIHNMGYTDCAPVHRIDRETSGLLVCARKSNTRSEISRLFRDTAIQKVYLAITKGHAPVADHFHVSTPIGTPEKSAIRLKLWVDGQNAIPAHTEFYTLARLDDYHLFACIPKTGRTNQIRIHLASIGQWLVGDKMYHPNENVFLEFYEKGYTDWVHENVLFSRHLLHNAAILIPGLVDQFVIAPIPSDMFDYPIAAELFRLSQLTKDLKTLQIKNLCY